MAPELFDAESIDRRHSPPLEHGLCGSTMDISAHHFQGSVSQYVLKHEYVPTLLVQEVGSIGMATKVSVQPGYTGSFAPPIQRS